MRVSSKKRTDCDNGLEVPEYLKRLVLEQVGGRTNYNLRNAQDLR